ncbi:hypothetical protein CSB45_10325 [candidate division KSB3 bacterium]|uniref:Right handed beta helix domain-containing protein n=1 Tax=candidate division KSB3 bacterium TaxID=2044937 RepID=A0A2G6E4E2_9BACT|nr:MAG: hypothetical protein CSB45_10325 [candidate division KSB3 bacterium]PIE29190.1 MAG: hypothetical protein CSA57_10300 [candidate division KSB3 bacterium]
MTTRVMIVVCFIGIFLSGCGKDKQEPSPGYTLPDPTVRESRTLYVPSDYRTIQHAVDAAVSGDFIRIAAGAFHEDVQIKHKALSLRGAGPGQTVIQGLLSIENSSEASVEALTIQGGGIDIKDSTARISGNEILNSPGPGIHLESCADSIISDNDISYNLKEGILSNESNGVIGSNHIKHNGTDGIVVNNASPTLQVNYVSENQRDGISIRAFSHYTAPLLIQNRVMNNGSGGNYDIICYGPNSNPTGTGNLFSRCLNCAECHALDDLASYERGFPSKASFMSRP